ncbi:MAG: hypothetical protein SGJ04_03850 [Bacteroidota bacterium]|nr:hypothetical protein [Bacteroidota bacterium]
MVQKPDTNKLKNSVNKGTAITSDTKKPWYLAMLPHFIAIMVLLIMTVVYLQPVLKGKMLPQNDVKQFNGSFEEIRKYYAETGDRSLWTNSMFGGMPTYQISPSSPNSMLGTISIYNVLVSGWSLPKPLNAMFLYGLSFYLMLLAFRVRAWLALVGAIAYSLASFNIIIIEAGHMLQAYALGTAPLVIAGAAYMIKWRRLWLGAGLFALALALNLRTSHIQMSYYVGIVLGLYVASEFLFGFLNGTKKYRIHLLKCIPLLGIASLIAIGTTATLQWTTYEYGKESTRGKSELTTKSSNKTGGLDLDYAFEHSISQGEALSLMIPNVRGGASSRISDASPAALKKVNPNIQEQVANFDAYWGGQSFTGGPAYAGAIICMLFILGLFVTKGNHRLWMGIAALISVLLAMGKYAPGFNEFIFYNFPFYNKFRSVAFTLIMAELVLPLLAMITIEQIIRHAQAWDKKQLRNFFIGVGIPIVICLGIALTPSSFFSLQKPDEYTKFTEMARGQIPEDQVKQTFNTIMPGVETARGALASADALRSLIFMLLVAGAIYLYHLKRIKHIPLIVIIGVLVLVDLYSLDQRYLNEKKFLRKTEFEADNLPTPADEKILTDKDPHYRVLNLTKDNVFSDATTSFFHKSIGGYHGAKLKRIQEINERYMYEVVGLIQQNMRQMPAPLLLEQLNAANKLGPINMLNTKYLIVSEDANGVVQNPYSYGNAWLVKGWKINQTADAEIASLGSTNLKDTATLMANNAKYVETLATGGDSTDNISLTQYRPNGIVYEANLSANRLAVFSEVYYDNGLGWNAYIDGKKEEHIKVDYLLRGLAIPRGKHKIEFKFEPESYVKGEKITLACSLALIALLGLGVFTEYKRRGTKIDDNEDKEMM